MRLGSHFDTSEQSRLGLEFLEPRQTDDAYALEASWLGAGFPDTGTEEFDALSGESVASGQNLFFTFGATRACDDERTFNVELRQQRRECHFHNV